MNKYETAMDKIKQEYSAELEKVKKEADEIQADYQHCRNNDIDCIKRAIELKQYENSHQAVENTKKVNKRNRRR